MSGRRRGPILVAIMILSLMAAGLALSATRLLGDRELESAEQLMLVAAFGAYGVVGALIVARRPENRIGWLFSGIGVLAMATSLLDQSLAWVTDNIVNQQQPGGAAMALVVFGEGFWYPFFGMFLIMVPLLYPTGGAISKRWAWVGWIGIGALLAVAALGMLQEQFVFEAGEAGSQSVQTVDIVIDNPIGIAGIPNPEESALGDGLLGLALLTGLSAWASVIVRYRRASRIERLQLKWLMSAYGLMLAWILIVDVVYVDLLGNPSPFGSDLWFALIVLAVPVSAGVAILRYRLYEIDRIISRTVTYAMVAGVLALVYAGGVFALTRLVPATGDLAVAASTLAAAALFNPLRHRVQGWVDRRFNRSRYDAQRLVDGFSERLRSEVGMGEVIADLRGVVSRTVEPTSATVWVRESIPGFSPLP